MERVGRSLSSTLTCTEEIARVLPYGAVPLVMRWVSDALSSSLSVSVAAVTLTVCAVLQFVVLNVNVFWLPLATESVSTVTSVLSLAIVITVSPAGALSSTTVYSPALAFVLPGSSFSDSELLLSVAPGVGVTVKVLEVRSPMSRMCPASFTFTESSCSASILPVKARVSVAVVLPFAAPATLAMDRPLMAGTSSKRASPEPVK